jgi:hypothetical protein
VNAIVTNAPSTARILGGSDADQRARRSLPWFVLAAIAACSRPAERTLAATEPPSLVTSNILRDDYAGSRKCADCHGAIYDAWERSPMHRMTRLAQDRSIEAPFDGATLRVGSDSATVETRSSKRYVILSSAQDGHHVYRVTKVIGGRGGKQDIPAIAPHLAHEYPLVRYYAKHAIETLGGTSVPIDVEQPADEVRAEVERRMTP